MNVLISAGESSGDTYGHRLATLLQLEYPQASISAVGGPRLAQVATMVADSSDWGAIGIVQAIKIQHKVRRGAKIAEAHLQNTPPGLFIPIDYGYVNAYLANAAKQAGWKVLYFIPPSSWRRELRSTKLAGLVDIIVTPFPWNAKAWQEAGVQAHYFGHPIKQLVDETEPDPNATGTVALLPGSRKHEVDSLLPVMKHTIEDLKVKATICPAPTVSAENLQAIWGGSKLPQLGETRPTLKAAQAAIVCSGSATLEAALAGCPCVVVYRGNWIMEIEYKLRGSKIEFISLPNILLERSAVPELVLDDANPEDIGEFLTELLDENSPMRQAQLASFAEIREGMPDTDVFKSTVDLVKTLDFNF